MNIALCFCVRNCGIYLDDIFKNIEQVKSLNFNVYTIFVYDNCIDNSENKLKKYQQKNNNVIIKTITNKSIHRTERIAKARNACLDILYNELDNISYHLMIDCDDRCSSKWNIEVINNYLNNFDNDNWDSISFNRDGYYDIWALLFEDFKQHCFGFGHYNSKVIPIMKFCIEKKLKKSETNSIDVLSAFNGFAIYKTDRFKGYIYDGLYSNYEELIKEEDIECTINKLKEFNVYIENIPTIECCEHIFYHLSALKEGRKIKISKFKVV